MPNRSGECYHSEIDELWLAELDRLPKNARLTWLGYGRLLGSLSRVPEATLKEYLISDDLGVKSLWMLVQGGRSSLVLDSVSLSSKVMRAIVSGEITDGGSRADVLSRFATLIRPDVYTEAFDNVSPAPLWNTLSLWLDAPEPEAEPAIGAYASHIRPVNDVLDLITSLGRLPAAEWATSLGPWSQLVEKLREHWPDCWAATRLANCAAGVRGSVEFSEGGFALLDDAVPLCARVRYARTRVNAQGWWESQVCAAGSVSQRMVVALALLTWAGVAIIIKMSNAIETLLDSLSMEQWRLLFLAIQQSRGRLRVRENVSLRARALPPDISPRLAVVLGIIGKLEDAQLMLDRYLRGYDGADKVIHDFVARVTINAAAVGWDPWSEAVNTAKRAYARGIHQDHDGPTPRIEPSTMELQAAYDVLEHADAFPRYLVYTAEERAQLEIEKMLIPVADIAERDGWFDDGGAQE